MKGGGSMEPHSLDSPLLVGVSRSQSPKQLPDSAISRSRAAARATASPAAIAAALGNTACEEAQKEHRDWHSLPEAFELVVLV
ncbi:hypothetical protein EYF80_021396 [Liparis tanakae]|uniref:Uncharacterized protein n=1 Tax=Liparis tanakae TaxID=230148 RepID=A0A4Z2HTR6_9TELE|nr:hypothetical protein EYF80_021396 [Liparis tanakae]